jgi:hypothetical protein
MLSSVLSSTSDKLRTGLSGITDSDAAETWKQRVGAAQGKLSGVTEEFSDQIGKIKQGITTRRDLPETVQALQTQVDALQTKVDGLDEVIKILLTFDRDVFNLFRIRDAFPPAIKKSADNLQNLINDYLIKYNIS